jgi:hypothetical protein
MPQCISLRGNLKIIEFVMSGMRSTRKVRGGIQLKELRRIKKCVALAAQLAYLLSCVHTQKLFTYFTRDQEFTACIRIQATKCSSACCSRRDLTCRSAQNYDMLCQEIPRLNK